MAEKIGKMEGMHEEDCIRDLSSEYYNNLKGYAMDILNFFQCFKCKNPFYGGRKECAGAEDFKEEDLVCGKCASESLEFGDLNCKEHGTEYIEFKCRFCCSMSKWFCWGNTHFCDSCHKKHLSGDHMHKKR